MWVTINSMMHSQPLATQNKNMDEEPLLVCQQRELLNNGLRTTISKRVYADTEEQLCFPTCLKR
jgi:hypothetical protein